MNAINIGSTSSSNGNNMVTLNLKDVTVSVPSSVKPVSIASTWTFVENGTNSYTTGGTSVRYDGTAIEAQ